MKPILLTLTGSGVSLAAAFLALLLGLQTRHINSLLTYSAVVGAGGALAGDTTLTRFRKLSRQSAIAPDQLDKAIGAISERHSLSPNALDIAVALQELKGEIDATN